MKQTIQEYCKENKLWAAKDYTNEWFTFDAKKVNIDDIFLISNISKKYFIYFFKEEKKENIIFPDIVFNKSLVAPDGTMPLLSLQNKWRPKKNEPIFVWNDLYDGICPVMYCDCMYCEYIDIDSIAINEVKVIDFIKVNKEIEDFTIFNHCRKFDVALLGVPRKEWPESKYEL